MVLLYMIINWHLRRERAVEWAGESTTRCRRGTLSMAHTTQARSMPVPLALVSTPAPFRILTIGYVSSGALFKTRKALFRAGATIRVLAAPLQHECYHRAHAIVQRTD